MNDVNVIRTFEVYSVFNRMHVVELLHYALVYVMHAANSIASVHSAVEMSTWQQTVVDMNEKFSRSTCSVVECFPEKSRWRWNEQVCQGVKCKTL